MTGAGRRSGCRVVEDREAVGGVFARFVSQDDGEPQE